MEYSTPIRELRGQFSPKSFQNTLISKVRPQPFVNDNVAKHTT